MAHTNTFDCAATDLFCNEETKSLCFDDDGPLHDYQINGEKQAIFSNGRSDSTALIDLPILSDECIGFMVEREREHLPRDDYMQRLRNGELDVGLRKEALDWMFKACAHFNFGELCLYSAMTYLDRFLSIHELPLSPLENGGKNWIIQLVAIACLSVAAKIEEVNVPSALDLQTGIPELLFQAKTIQRMEILVLNSLKWKIKAYTPCNFIDYYLRKINGNKSPSGDRITRSLQVILSTMEGIEFLDFRPSEIAAAVAVYVSRQMQEMDIDKVLSCLIGVEKGRVVKCLESIQESVSVNVKNTINIVAATTNEANLLVSSSLPRSPNGVLEAACLSYKSNERSVGSCPTSSHSKRRKLDQSATVGRDS